MLRTDTIQITPEMLDLIARIDEFRGTWRYLGTLEPDRLSALRRVSTIESIGSSTRIEGSRLSDRQVERLLSNLTITRFETRDEQEVAGYAELMDLLFRSWEDIPFNENHIKQLHQILLQYSQKDEWHNGEPVAKPAGFATCRRHRLRQAVADSGVSYHKQTGYDTQPETADGQEQTRSRGVETASSEYKTGPNSVAAFDENGEQIGIVFETATPFDTPRLMAELVQWVNDALGKAGPHTLPRALAALHPLLAIGIFIVVFLEIHPFQDGNGRLSRALTTLLLLQAGYTYVPYNSLESVIEANKEGYYLALRQTQGTIRTDAPNWQPWLLFFLRSLAEQVRRLEKKVELEKTVLATLPTLSLQIVEYARGHGRVTMAEAVKLTGASRNTLKLHFRSLTGRGHLEQHGHGRGVWYALK